MREKVERYEITEKILRVITFLMNIIHDLIVVTVSKFGLTINDK